MKELIESGIKYDLVIAIGPVPMMKFIASVTAEYGIETKVSLNPIMIDGTGMCGGCRVKINGETVTPELVDGYIYIDREWKKGDSVSLELNMEARRVYTNTKVRANAYQVAILRGPIVYCVEEADNGKELSALSVSQDAPITAEHVTDADLGRVTKLEVKGYRAASGDSLYSETKPELTEVSVTLVPYYAWGNREAGEMRVWLQEK